MRTGADDLVIRMAHESVLEYFSSPMFHRRQLRFALSSYCLGMIVLHVVILWLARGQVMEGVPDLRIFYTAALMLRRGEGNSLYDDAAQWRTQQEFVSLGTSDNNLLPYNHPPFEAIPFLPLTHLTFLRAYCVWFLVNGLLLGISMYVIRPWIPATATEFPELFFLAPLAFFPVFYALMQGQDSILLLMLYCFAYAALGRGRDLQAGIWLGLGLFKFHLVLPFAFILLLRRRWRFIGGIALSGCAEIAVSLPLVGWRELLSYPRYAWFINRLQAKAYILPANMPNLRGLIAGWTVSPATRSKLELTLLVASIGLLVWAAKQWTAWNLRSSNHWNIGFSIAVVTTFLVGYHGYNQDLSIALLPILITFNRLLQSNGSRIHIALRIILAVLFFSPIYLFLTLLYNQHHFFALVLLAFVFCLGALCSQEGRRGTGSYAGAGPV
jgi:Glycosyltransferase family 87